MAYIGQQPVVGRYILLDQISGGFNGTTSGFTMSTAGGVQGVNPGLAQNVLLSLGGVIQQPGVDYTISGSGITFTTPPVSGTTFFATVLGDAQSVGTPSDGTVTPASIASGFDFGFPNVNVTGVITIASGSAATPSLSITGDVDTGLYSPAANAIAVTTSGNERMRIDSSGRLLVGTTSAVDSGATSSLQVVNTSTAIIALGRDDSSISAGNDLGAIRFYGNDGGSYQMCAEVIAEADGDHANDDKPSRLVFSTTADSGSSPAERMRVGSDGKVFFGNFTSVGATAYIEKATSGSFELDIVASRSTTTNRDIRFFSRSDTESMRIDTSGRLLIGTSSAINSDNSPSLEIVDTSTAVLSFGRNDTTISAGNALGSIKFFGNDGGSYQQCAEITATADLDHANNDKPTRLVFSTTADAGSSPTERMRIDSSGNVGIGVSSPSKRLHVSSSSAGVEEVQWLNNAQAVGANVGAGLVFTGTTSNNGLARIVGAFQGSGTGDGGYLKFDTRAETSGTLTERMRIDRAGRLLLGTTSARAHLNDGSDSGHFFLEGTTQDTTTLAIVRNSDNDGPAHLVLGKSRGGSANSTTLLQNGDTIGHINFEGADGTHLIRAAQISCLVAGDPGANDMPGLLKFSTTPDGSNALSERMRIDRDGRLMVGKSSAGVSSRGPEFRTGNNDYAVVCTSEDHIPQVVNRLGDEGQLIQFRHANSTEGDISVSGSTVSYNGGHLSRWSQLAGGAARIEILRGSVLSNLNEMCEWGEENNEQLNRMKVSDVEGDANVSGVFQGWDDDDDTYTNDFYCAMTGDFVIRIAQGTTVARGDLLMSAGDGTAKPQDDDIVRSKTIAKVTSTTVSTTYSDGSYCVPCVLMAC